MTMPTPTLHDSMLPVDFVPPLVTPASGGLFAATTWIPEGDEPPRWLASGVEVRPAGNFPGDQTGIWGASWCAQPGDLTEDDLKTGDRADGLDPFLATTVWAYDACDLTEPSRAEVQARAAQGLRMRESALVAREFAERLKLDATELPGTPVTAENIVAALAHIEGALSRANSVGALHLSPTWLPVLAEHRQLVRTGGGFTTISGHRLVLDGGYVEGLGDQIVATSQLFGWRDEPTVRTSLDPGNNVFAAVAERSVVVGYEALLASVTVDPAP